MLSEIIKTETKINEFNAVSDKIKDLNIQVIKTNTSVDELKKYTDKIHQEILLLENKTTNTSKAVICLKKNDITFLLFYRNGLT